MKSIWIGAFTAVFAMVFASTAFAQDHNMSFFVTSAGPGKGGDLGGLAGADAHCQKLAESAGAGGRTWRAYLSTEAPDKRGEFARLRIGGAHLKLVWPALISSFENNR